MRSLPESRVVDHWFQHAHSEATLTSESRGYRTAASRRYLNRRDELAELLSRVPQLSYREIGDEMGIPTGTIGNWALRFAKEEGIEDRRPRTPPPVDLDRLTAIQHAREHNVSWRQIGEWYGVTKQAAQQFYAMYKDLIVEQPVEEAKD